MTRIERLEYALASLAAHLEIPCLLEGYRQRAAKDLRTWLKHPVMDDTASLASKYVSGWSETDIAEFASKLVGRDITVKLCNSGRFYIDTFIVRFTDPATKLFNECNVNRECSIESARDIFIEMATALRDAIHSKQDDHEMVTVRRDDLKDVMQPVGTYTISKSGHREMKSEHRDKTFFIPSDVFERLRHAVEGKQ